MIFQTDSTNTGRPRVTRYSGYTTVSLLALCFGGEVAQAQEAARGEPAAVITAAAYDAPAPAGLPQEQLAQAAFQEETRADVIEDITVTGSRIVRDGYNAPTPVSVLTNADIQAQAPANVADFVNQLPSIAGSSTPAGSTGSLSGGQAGINAISLRGLGAGRSLVLLDGQRSVASTATGLVDVNTFPQQLIERVEVVTGGASAAYGSDAVGGVVNFILNKNFQGLQFTADTGITDYGDGEFYRFTATAGFSAMDGRLKVIASGEYYDLPGIHKVDRDWNRRGYFHINNPVYAPGNGEPERYVGFGIGPSNATPGGVVASGPLRGLYFGPIDPATGRATTGQLNYGQVSGPWMIGGDWEYTSSNWVGINSFQPGQERIGAFGRVMFELTPDIEIFGQASYNRDEGYSVYIQSINAGNLRIAADNAFLPESVRQQMIDNGLSTISLGSSNFGIPPGTATNVREVYRYVAGASGKFMAFNRNWSWDFYYQKGISKLNENLINTWHNARMNAATDAVYSVPGDPTSQIVCRINVDTNPDNDDPSCAPLNRIGMGGVTQAGIDYVMGTPYRLQTIKQDVASLTFSGDLFRLPGGTMAVAFGGEWRREQVDGFVEDQYRDGWQYGNYLPNVGKYDVTEGFVELAMPVFQGFELNAAGRFTHYSTSGDVQTWKVGATYQPIDDIKFRGTISHDIRAPNLDELFAAGTGRSNTVLINGQSTEYQQLATGNSNLKPEVADSWTIGAVFTPTFLPGFAISADYYEVDITDAINSLQPQIVADMCYLQNIAEQCANITTRPDGQLQIRLAPLNFARQRARGLDLEATYRAELGAGQLTLRGLATHYIENLLNNGIDAPIDTAGSNDGTWGGGPASWVYRLSALYNVEPFTFSLIGRGVSSGKISNAYIECQSDCPASTVEHRTINNNHVDGKFWLDSSITFAFQGWANTRGELQFTVANILNTDPALIGRGPTGNSAPSYPATNQSIYDMYGRTYRISARLKF